MQQTLYFAEKGKLKYMGLHFKLICSLQKNNPSGVNFKFKLQIQKLKQKNERLNNAYSKKQGNAETYSRE